jgi:hypothetical protein
MGLGRRGWQRLGEPVDTARPLATLGMMRRLLQHGLGPYAAYVDIFGYGSVRNGTATARDIDVDIMVELLRPGLVYDHLTQEVPKPTEHWIGLRKAVESVLVHAFDPVMVRDGDNAITLTGEGSRVSVDVTVAQRLHTYRSDNEREVDGLAFWDVGRRQAIFRVGHPRAHYANVEKIDARTSGAYRSTVRACKLARRHLPETSLAGIGTGQAVSSFHIESLLYNLPERYFHAGVRRTVKNLRSWCLDNLDDRRARVLRTPAEQFNLTRIISPCDRPGDDPTSDIAPGPFGEWYMDYGRLFLEAIGDLL